MYKKTVERVCVKGAIESCKRSLEEIEKESKEVYAKMDLHGKILSELTLRSMSLHNQKKRCLETIDLLTKFAKSQGEEV